MGWGTRIACDAEPWQKISPWTAGYESLQTRADLKEKEGTMPWCVRSVADFRSRFSQFIPSLSFPLPSALLGGWVTRRKCLGSASVGPKTRCVAWRWWGRDATETKYKPAYRDTSEGRGQEGRLIGPALSSAGLCLFVPSNRMHCGAAVHTYNCLGINLCGGILLVKLHTYYINTE